LVGLFQQAWKVELILIAVSALGVYAAYTLHAYWAAFIVVGLFIGALARDVGSFRRVIQIWPVFAEVLDWQRVDQLLDQDRTQMTTKRDSVK
jgi:hypothetical protein